ncbi:hypothetical protein Tco_1076788 [Tanacetum coccineum]
MTAVREVNERVTDLATTQREKGDTFRSMLSSYERKAADTVGPVAHSEEGQGLEMRCADWRATFCTSRQFSESSWCADLQRQDLRMDQPILVVAVSIVPIPKELLMYWQKLKQTEPVEMVITTMIRELEICYILLRWVEKMVVCIPILEMLTYRMPDQSFATCTLFFSNVVDMVRILKFKTVGHDADKECHGKTLKKDDDR